MPRARRLLIVKALSPYVSMTADQRPRTRIGSAVSLVAYKTAVDVAGKAVTLVVTIAAARVLTPADFGVMALAMTTGWLLGVASDAGLPMFAATQAAHARAAGLGSYPIAREVMRWRLASGLLAMLGGAAIAILLVPAGAVLAFTFIVLHQLAGAILDTLAHVYRGLGRTDVESTVALAHRGTVAAGALTVLATRPTLMALAISLAIPPVLALLASAVIAKRVTRDGPAFALAPHTWATHVLPLGAGILLSALYFRIDVYFLQLFHGVDVVGRYNAAFRMIDAVRLFPAAVLAVAYPMLCTTGTRAQVRRLSLLLGGTSIVIGGAMYGAASPLLATLYGDGFVTASAALRVLALSLPLLFINYALTHQVIAWGHQRAYFAIAAAALCINVLANLLLIPDFEMVGAAWSTLLTEVVVCAGCLQVLRRR
jgi:O-antigen/teichoic acid export membrane protein